MDQSNETVMYDHFNAYTFLARLLNNSKPRNTIQWNAQAPKNLIPRETK